MLFLFLSSNLFSSNYLKSEYLIKNDYVLLSDIEKHTKKDVILFHLETNMHSLRVKSKTLLNTLKKHEVVNYASRHSYVQFSKQSPINVDKIKNALKEEYLKNYPSIVIKNINVHPRGYLDSLPQTYEVGINGKMHLSDSGILYIKTKDNKKIFFNYEVMAKVEVILARVEIQKGQELSNINTTKNSIMLAKFRAPPLQSFKNGALQSKHRIKSGTVLTSRDITGLLLVKKGSNVNVSFYNAGISISFSAVASRGAKLGQSVYVTNSNGKKIKVVITGRNKARIK